ncbi:hypothetical protein Ddc_14448 [Ditylenchus destructor]|nr:hypothetical protein Ddc_14448 [Ditylenchus destructor]
MGGASAADQFQAKITNNCLDQSERRDCSVFNRCCDFRCAAAMVEPGQSPLIRHNSKNGAHFCMALLGQIVEQNTKCICSAAPQSRSTGPFQWGNSQMRLMAKVDFVGGIILIFVIDLFLLSLTL